MYMTTIHAQLYAMDEHLMSKTYLMAKYYWLFPFQLTSNAC